MERYSQASCLLAKERYCHKRPGRPGCQQASCQMRIGISSISPFCYLKKSNLFSTHLLFMPDSLNIPHPDHIPISSHAGPSQTCLSRSDSLIQEQRMSYTTVREGISSCLPLVLSET